MKRCTMRPKTYAGMFLFIGLVLAGLVVGLVANHYFSKGPDAVVSVLPKDVKKGISVNQVHHVATRDSVTEWILDAQSVHFQKAENKTVLKDISATFFLNGGKSIHLTGRDGMVLTDTNDMEVFGDVVVRTGPYELNTEKLCYDHKSRSISTDTPIVVKGDGIRLTGNSLFFSFDTEHVLVRGGVEAVFEQLRLL